MSENEAIEKKWEPGGSQPCHQCVTASSWKRLRPLPLPSAVNTPPQISSTRSAPSPLFSYTIASIYLSSIMLCFSFFSHIFHPFVFHLDLPRWLFIIKFKKKSSVHLIQSFGKVTVKHNKIHLHTFLGTKWRKEWQSMSYYLVHVMWYQTYVRGGATLKKTLCCLS